MGGSSVAAESTDGISIATAALSRRLSASLVGREQGFHATPQLRILPARSVEEGGTLARRSDLHGVEEELPGTFGLAGHVDSWLNRRLQAVRHSGPVLSHSRPNYFLRSRRITPRRAVRTAARRGRKSSGGRPLPATDAQGLGRLLHAQPGEVAELDQLGRLEVFRAPAASSASSMARSSSSGGD